MSAEIGVLSKHWKETLFIFSLGSSGWGHQINKLIYIWYFLIDMTTIIYIFNFYITSTNSYKILNDREFF